ncbi:MAG TPA: uracil-DNA glycosylase family protein [Phycisphaerales bacterium]|nr:uracil-DNA glycosylase family protein [Phycisphaerales bacterium]
MTPPARQPATSLPLLREVRRCRVCVAHLPNEPRPLVVASASSRVVIIGQAPGRIAHETGVPWNDKSGERLREWLGVTDAQFYDESLFAIVPMGLCYPGRAKGGDKPPRPECAPLWHPRILPRLERVELTIYIGRYAFEQSPPRLAGQVGNLTEGVRAARGLLPGRIVLPHPSPRNQMWIRRNPWFERDVLPALRARVLEVLGSMGGARGHRAARRAPPPSPLS